MSNETKLPPKSLPELPEPQPQHGVFEQNPGSYRSQHGDWYFSCDSQHYQSVLVGRHSLYTRVSEVTNPLTGETSQISETFPTTCPVLGLQFIAMDYNVLKDVELLIEIETRHKPVLPRAQGHDTLNFYVIPTLLLYHYGKLKGQQSGQTGLTRQYTREELRKRLLVATTEIGILILHNDYE